jgi:hypothetical protein
LQAQVQPKDKELQELHNEVKVIQEKKDREIFELKEQMARWRSRS